MFDLNQLINDLPLEVDGCPLQIWRENGKESWDVAYNTCDNCSKEIVWEQGETLLEAVQKMLKLLSEEKSKCCGARASWDFTFKSCYKCGKKFEPIKHEMNEMRYCKNCGMIAEDLGFEDGCKGVIKG